MDEDNRALEPVNTDKELISQASQLIKALTLSLQERSVNADVGEAIRNNNEWWPVEDVVKKINFEIKHGKSVGRNQLYNFMMNTGMAMYPKDFVSGAHYYAPKQIHVDHGRMKEGVTETNQENRQGEQISNHRLLIGTTEGVPYIMKKLDEAKSGGLIEDLCSSWRVAQGWN